MKLVLFSPGSLCPCYRLFEVHVACHRKAKATQHPAPLRVEPNFPHRDSLFVSRGSRPLKCSITFVSWCTQMLTLSQDRANSDKVLGLPRIYTCQCGRPAFFRNSVCLSCQTALDTAA